MSLIEYFDSYQLAIMLRVSNYWANHNGNKYPEKIQNAVNELYEWVDCQCDGNCDCKIYGCEKHLIRKKNPTFERYHQHFLDCFVDRKLHNPIREGRKKGRGYRAVKAIEIIRNKWDEEFSSAIDSKSLVCSGWSIEPYASFSKEFKPGPKNIYLSKWMALLSLNTYVAYDNGSVSLLNRDYDNPKTYFELMDRIRRGLIVHLQKNRKSVSDFQLYDNPNEFYSSIPRGSFRPIGNIIDKLYLTL